MNPDIFICGTCKHQFNDVGMYMNHKEMCNMTNGQTCNFVTSQAHVTNPNQHCAVSGHLGTINDQALSTAPVHHDHAYFHYEAPALVANEVSGSAQQQASSGLLMDMLSSLDGAQMAPTFTEQVVEEFMPPPPVCSQPEQPVISMADQHAAPMHHIQQQSHQQVPPHMHQVHPQIHHPNSSHQQQVQPQSQLQHSQGHMQQQQHHHHQPQSHTQQPQSHMHQQQGHIQQPQNHMPQNHLQQLQSHIQQPQTHIQQPQSHIQQSQSHIQQSQGHIQQSQSHIQQSQGHIQQSQSHIQQPQGHIQQSQSHIQQPQGHIQQPQGHIQQPQSHIQQPQGHIQQPQGHIQQPQGHIQQPQSHMQQQPQSHIQQPQGHMQQPQTHIQQPQSHIQQQPQTHIQQPQGHMQQQLTHIQQPQNHIQQQPQSHMQQQQLTHIQQPQGHIQQPQTHIQQPQSHIQQPQTHMQPPQSLMQQPQSLMQQSSQLPQHHMQHSQSQIPLPQPQQMQPQPAVTSVYNTHMGVPVNAPSPAMTGGYLAAVQRTEPLLVVSNGVLTYVSPGMLESGQTFSAAPDTAAELPTEPLEATSSDATRAPKDLDGTSGSQDGSGQLLSRMATPRLQCPFCRRRFRRNFDLQMHVRTHTGEKPFQCIVCGRAFAQRCNVKRHMESHKVWPTAGPGGGTLPDIHTFEVRLAENRQLIVRPTKSIDHVMERREYRVLYGRSGRSAAANAEAAGAAGGSGRSTEETLVLVDNCWECRFCRSRFEDFQKLRSHMRQHSDQQVYLCVLSDCRQTFKQLDAFLEHLEAHQQKKEMVYVCHVCHKSFVTVQELGEHYNDHCKDPTRPKAAEGDKATYKCPECGHIFRRPAALQAHLVTSHARGPSAFICSHCDKAFATEAALRHHIPLHGSLATYQCPRCPKAFKTRQYLRIHERTEHDRNSPFSCTRCSRGFLSRPALRAHILSAHEPHRKHKCPLAAATGCQFETAAASAIASHLASHSAQLRRPCPCAHCGCRFANTLLLRRHLKKHRAAQRKGAEGGDLECGTCGRRFLRRAPFDNHEVLCRQTAAQRERRRQRKEQQEAEPKPEAALPKPEQRAEAEAEAPQEGRPQRRRKFTAFWKPKRRRRRRPVEEPEEEASEEEDRDVYDPLRAIIGCQPACSSGPSLPGIATFNQAITADHLDIAALVRPPNQNAPYTCSEDLKLLEVGDQFEEGRGPRAGSDEQGVTF